MRRIGMQLIKEKKAALRAQSFSTVSEKEGVSKNDIQDRDLLTLLIKANMATDIPEEQRLTDEEVLAREHVPIFFHVKALIIHRGSDVSQIILATV